MVYDEELAGRIRKIVAQDKSITEKKMFGGLSFLLNKKMFCGVLKSDLVLKMSHDQCTGALKEPHVRPMDFTGRPLKGFVYVSPKGCTSDEGLKRWIGLSYDYAKAVERQKK